MNKKNFLSAYLNLHNASQRLQLRFDRRVFLDPAIKLETGMRRYSQLLELYVARCKKNGRPDMRDISERRHDPDTALVTLRTVAAEPATWDLEFGDRTVPKPMEIWHIPLATDLRTDRSIILDSTHLLANFGLTGLSPDIHLPVVVVTGHDIEDLLPDFEILNRQMLVS
jgi:hypothetical protein